MLDHLPHIASAMRENWTCLAQLRQGGLIFTNYSNKTNTFYKIDKFYLDNKINMDSTDSSYRFHYNWDLNKNLKELN